MIQRRATRRIVRSKNLYDRGKAGKKIYDRGVASCGQLQVLNRRDYHRSNSKQIAGNALTAALNLHILSRGRNVHFVSSGCYDKAQRNKQRVL